MCVNLFLRVEDKLTSIDNPKHGKLNLGLSLGALNALLNKQTYVGANYVFMRKLCGSLWCDRW